MLNCSIFLTLGQLCMFCKNTEQVHPPLDPAVTQHLLLLSLKWREPTQRNESPTSSSLMEMKAQEMKGKESLLSFQVTLFSPSFGSGVSFPHCGTSPSRSEAHLPPPVAPRLVPRELRPLWVHNTYSH